MKKIIKIILLINLILIFISSFVFAESNPSNVKAMKSDFVTNSPHVFMMEMSTGTVLYEKDAFAKIYPASTTKIMTAILTVENCELTDHAVVSAHSVDSIPYSYAIADLRQGEILTIEQLLYSLLIESANDAAIVLAEHIAGSEEAFADMCNKKAKEIGCLNTHFVNPNGIFAEDHYCTTYDLALMGKYAMQYEAIRKIAKTPEYHLEPDAWHPDDNRFFKHTNLLIRKDREYYYPNAIGLKTGYTDASKSTIVAIAEKNGYQYLISIAGGDTDEANQDLRFLDCINLFEYAFNNFEFRYATYENKTIKDMDLEHGDKDNKTLHINTKNNLEILCSNDIDLENYQPEIIFNREKVDTPIIEGEELGTAKYTINGLEYEVPIVAGNTLIQTDYIKVLVIIGLALLIVIILMRYKHKKKRKSKGKSKGKRYATKHSRPDGYDLYRK